MENFVPTLEGEQVINPATGEVFRAGELQARATDPLVLPQPYSTPADFTAQYPQPLDTTEIIAMCEELSVWQAIPEKETALNAETWRELTSMAFVSGSSYLFFADGECPEEYTHDGGNVTVTNKNLGAKKSLSMREIKHSLAVAAANWNGINRIIGGFPAGEGVPGGSDLGTFAVEAISGLKEKEVRLAMTLTLNGWDRYLVRGDSNTNSLEFDGIENYFDNVSGCTLGNSNDNSASGTFGSTAFDRFLGEACAKPTHIFGHPQAIQELLLAYFSLGFQGSQIVNFASGDRIVPGYNFAGFINTGLGRMAVVADNWFTVFDMGNGAFQADLWALRMNHNGEPLIYKQIQIPLSLVDLTPGCTAITFEIWAATSLVIKACCAQSQYTAQFTGRIQTTCTQIG
jgi:hypothetical protein